MRHHTFPQHKCPYVGKWSVPYSHTQRQTPGCFVSIPQSALTLSICTYPVCSYIPRMCFISLAPVLTDSSTFCALYKFVYSAASCGILSQTKCMLSSHTCPLRFDQHVPSVQQMELDILFFHLNSFLTASPFTDPFMTVFCGTSTS